jgi:hypothetical protein
MGLIYELWDICTRLSKSGPFKSSLGLDELSDWEKLHVVLFRIQLFFVVGHEYTHHVHGDLKGVFASEFVETFNSGSLEHQAMEVNADGYSAYHVLTHLIDGEGRSHALDLLGTIGVPELLQDRVLFCCFVAATAAYFLVRRPVAIDGTTVYALTHPPQAARMNCLMQRAMKWCEQNRAPLVAWMTLDKFQLLMSAVEQSSSGMNGGADWSAQTAFLKRDSSILGG